MKLCGYRLFCSLLARRAWIFLAALSLAHGAFGADTESVAVDSVKWDYFALDGNLQRIRETGVTDTLSDIKASSSSYTTDRYGNPQGAMKISASTAITFNNFSKLFSGSCELNDGLTLDETNYGEKKSSSGGLIEDHGQYYSRTYYYYYPSVPKASYTLSSAAVGNLPIITTKRNPPELYASYSMWFKLDEVPSTTRTLLSRKIKSYTYGWDYLTYRFTDYVAYSNRLFEVQLLGSDSAHPQCLKFEYYTSSASYTSSAQVTVGVWHNLTVVSAKNGDGGVYLDGVRVASGMPVGMQLGYFHSVSDNRCWTNRYLAPEFGMEGAVDPNPVTLTIGNIPGAIDDVVFYHSSLTSTQVKNLYAEQVAPIHEHDGVTFEKRLTSDFHGGSLAPGNYYLSGDLSLTSPIEVSGETTICLAGHVVKGACTYGIEIAWNSDRFELYDCGENEYHFSENTDGDWCVWTYDDNGLESVKGGVITGFSSGIGGHDSDHSRIVLHGGNIVGNRYAGVEVWCGIDICGANLIGNGVYGASSPWWTLSKGEVRNNGNGLSNGPAGELGPCTLSGGVISGNFDDGIEMFGGRLIVGGDAVVTDVIKLSEPDETSSAASLLVFNDDLRADFSGRVKLMVVGAVSDPVRISKSCQHDYSSAVTSADPRYAVRCQRDEDGCYLVLVSAEAEKPVITSIEGDSKVYGESATVKIEASVADGHSVDYKWYLCDDGETPSEPVSGGVAASCVIPDRLDVGAYAYRCVVTATLLANGATASVTSEVATVTITPKPLVVTADPKTQIYGESAKTLTYSTDGLISGDVLTGALAREQGESVGEYDILQGALTNGNYAINYKSAKYTIVDRIYENEGVVVAKADDGWDVTLTNDVSKLRFADNLGQVRVHLNGFKVAVPDVRATWGIVADTAITIYAVPDVGPSTQLAILGAGSIIGGSVVWGGSEVWESLGTAGDGVCVNVDSRNGVEVSVGDDVKVCGGGDYASYGGVGVRGVVRLNQGEILGGSANVSAAGVLGVVYTNHGQIKGGDGVGLNPFSGADGVDGDVGLNAGLIDCGESEGGDGNSIGGNLWAGTEASVGGEVSGEWGNKTLSLSGDLTPEEIRQAAEQNPISVTCTYDGQAHGISAPTYEVFKSSVQYATNREGPYTGESPQFVSATNALVWYVHSSELFEPPITNVAMVKIEEALKVLKVRTEWAQGSEGDYKSDYVANVLTNGGLYATLELTSESNWAADLDVPCYSKVGDLLVYALEVPEMAAVETMVAGYGCDKKESINSPKSKILTRDGWVLKSEVRNSTEILTDEGWMRKDVTRNTTYLATEYHDKGELFVVSNIVDRTIDDGGASGDENPASYSGVYDGQEHGISVAVRKPEAGYSIRYSLTKNGEYKDECPTLSNVCSSVPVWYEITAPGYNCLTNNATVTITAKPLMVTADAKTQVYGGEARPLTYTTVGLITGDVLSGELTREPGEDVGEYDILQGTLANGNYAISYTGAKYTIKERIYENEDVVIEKTDDGWDVTLTNDVSGGLRFPDNLGNVRIMLNGYKVVGHESVMESGYNHSSPTLDPNGYYVRDEIVAVAGGNGICVYHIQETGDPTRLFLSNSMPDTISEVRGGAGFAGQGGAGVRCAEDVRDGVGLSLSENVKIVGGAGSPVLVYDYGHKCTTPFCGGDGVVGLVVRNDGEITGGEGGDGSDVRLAENGGTGVVGDVAVNYGNINGGRGGRGGDGDDTCGGNGGDGGAAVVGVVGENYGQITGGQGNDSGWDSICTGLPGSGGAGVVGNIMRNIGIVVGGDTGRFGAAKYLEGDLTLIRSGTGVVGNVMTNDGLIAGGDYWLDCGMLREAYIYGTLDDYGVSASGVKGEVYDNRCVIASGRNENSGSVGESVDGSVSGRGILADGCCVESPIAEPVLYDGCDHKYERNTYDYFCQIVSSDTGRNVGNYTYRLGMCRFADHLNFVNNKSQIDLAWSIVAAKIADDGSEPGQGVVPEGGLSKFDATYVYDGEGHTIKTQALYAVTLVGSTPSFSFSLDGETGWQNDPFVYTNVGEFVMWYKITAPNYEDYKHQAKVTIQPLELTVTFDANGGSCPTASKTVTHGATYGTLPAPTWTGHIFVGWYRAVKDGDEVKSSTAVSIMAPQTLYAHWVSVTGVSAKQRYPWNGLVDIVVTFAGGSNDVAKVDCSFIATNSATKAALSVATITRKGADTGKDNAWSRQFVWDAGADVGEVKIDDVALTVAAGMALGGVQLWENGPYWAECNIGATKPEGFGYYFWWGDTVGYKRNENDSGWISVKGPTSFSFSFNGENCPTYGKSNSQLLSAGYIDSTGNLDAKYDAATVNLGAPWRMPTDEEMSALISNCDTTWITTNGVSGRLISGKGAYASNSVFLPAAGNGDESGVNGLGLGGFYWSSTPYSDHSACAWSVYFYSGDFYRVYYYCGRSGGQTVRPVRGFAEVDVVVVGATTHLSLDCRVGDRVSEGAEELTFSSLWDGDAEASVTIAQDGAAIFTGLTGEGVRTWTVERNGRYVLTHTTYKNGAKGKVESAVFVVEGKEVPVGELTIDWGQRSFVYDGQPKEPVITVKDRGTTLIKGTHYLVEYKDNVNVGTAKAIVTGIEPYVGEVMNTFTITKGTIPGGGEEPGSGEIPEGGLSKFDRTVVYNGKGQTIDVEKLEVAFAPYTSSEDDASPFRFAVSADGPWSEMAPTVTDIGELVMWYKVTSPNYEDYVHQAKVTVIQKEITDEMVQPGEDAFFFDGDDKKPTVDVVYEVDGKDICTENDYTLTYGTKAGAGWWVTVTGKGNYSGTVTKIVPVLKRPVAPPVITSKSYTGKLQKPTIPTDSRWTVVANPGGINVGEYPNVVLRLTNTTDYKWKGGAEDQTDITLVFKVTKGNNGWSRQPDMKGWAYGETPNEPSMGQARYGTVKVAYRKAGADVSTETATRPELPGKYIARFWVDETENFIGVAVHEPYKDIAFEITGSAPGGTETTTTPVPVPHDWLDAYVTEFGGGDYETAANAKGKNGVSLWESYVAGLDPTDPTSQFKAIITVGADGKPVITWEPDMSKADPPRVYVEYGKANLGDKDWMPVTDANRSAMHFFKVGVEIK